MSRNRVSLYKVTMNMLSYKSHSKALSSANFISKLLSIVVVQLLYICSINSSAYTTVINVYIYGLEWHPFA